MGPRADRLERPDRVPDLAGDVAGFAGSNRLDLPEGSVFLTGGWCSTHPSSNAIEREPDGAASVQAIIQHELGHLVGLDHVDDVTQLMNPVGSRGSSPTTPTATSRAWPCSARVAASRGSDRHS